jgi:DNA polymerase-4
MSAWWWLHPVIRGVVAAASYEARKFGVRSVTARRKCPDLTFVEPRSDVYKKVSLEIRAIFAEHTAIIEPLSLGEAYLDVTENHNGIASATEIAKQIKAKIRAETQLTASAGVSYNKFLAKLASDYRKPDGLFVITPAMGPSFVEALPVEGFHGVGPATAAKMNELGIRLLATPEHDNPAPSREPARTPAGAIENRYCFNNMESCNNTEAWL